MGAEFTARRGSQPFRPIHQIGIGPVTCGKFRAGICGATRGIADITSAFTTWRMSFFIIAAFGLMPSLITAGETAASRLPIHHRTTTGGGSGCRTRSRPWSRDWFRGFHAHHFGAL